MRFSSCLISVVALGLVAWMPPKKTEQSSYFPERVGDKLVYVYTNEPNKLKNMKEADVEEVDVVTSVKEKNGIKTVTIGRLGHDGKIYPHRKQEVSEAGIQQREDFVGGLLAAPRIYLKLPHKEGQTWDIDGFKETLTAYGPEEVKVPAGTYQAIRVEHRKQGDPKSEVIRTYWYAQQVGIVKVKDGDTLVLLKSFTPSKE